MKMKKYRIPFPMSFLDALLGVESKLKLHKRSTIEHDTEQTTKVLITLSSRHFLAIIGNHIFQFPKEEEH